MPRLKKYIDLPENKSSEEEQPKNLTVQEDINGDEQEVELTATTAAATNNEQELPPLYYPEERWR